MRICPFKVGDEVVFNPSQRTKGLYQDFSVFGLKEGKSYRVVRVKDSVYLYFEKGAGGMPWNEFRLKRSNPNDTDIRG